MTTEPQQIEVPTQSPGATEAAPLRLVLFGLPAAGKSSLLGALVQASDTQPVQLKGSVVDRSQRLAELRQRVYFSNQPTRTVEEVVPYPVEYRPQPPGEEPAPPLSAILIDCDGQVAIDLLRRRKSLTELSAERALARAVLDADALLLIIDASAPVKQMETDFAEFSAFLAQMELSRGARTDVGGLPVFLVLTKCDLIARPDQPREQWKKQIEERQRYVAERFKSFIRKRSEREKRTFGLIDLHQAATATSQPAFPDAGARPLEPFGVGTLFHQAFTEAALYRQRRREARRRLLWTIGLSGTVLGVLLGLVLALIFFPTSPFARDPRTTAERLSGTPDKLRQQLESLIAQRDSPEFAQLPAGRQEEIHFQIQELQDYLAYYQKLLEVGWPGVVESAEELRRIEEKLKTELTPPADWERTPAAKLRGEYLGDAQVLREASETARTWYQRTGDRLRDLWTLKNDPPPVNWRRFHDRSEVLLAETATPPFDPKDELRKGVGDLTWANALRIDTVRLAEKAEETYRKRLAQVRRVAAALGLIALGRDYPDVLDIPRDITLDEVAKKAEALQAKYPNYRSDFVAAELPETIRQEVVQAARQNYLYLLKPGRAEVLRQLQARGGDSPAGWQAVRRWLEAPQELAEWRTLARALNGLRVPPPPDPVAELADFLDKKSFTIRLQTVEVDIPLSLEVMPEAGALLRVHQPRVGTDPVVTLRLEDSIRDAGAGVQRLIFRNLGTPTLVVRADEAKPDEIYATLPLGGGKAIEWKRGARAARYSFQRLAEPPLLDGRVEEGIELRVREPKDGLPAVPDLLPEVPSR